MRWRLQGGAITPESFAIAGGRATFEANSWTAHYYITDHLGSTRAVTDTLGNVLATFDYTPYGELLASSDSTTAGTDYLFTGKERQAKQGPVNFTTPRRVSWTQEDGSSPLTRWQKSLVTRQS